MTMIATTLTSFPAVIVGDRCDCCGGSVTTTGCLRCTSSRQFCTCGVLVSCGCGRSSPHRCPNVVIVTGTLVSTTHLTTHLTVEPAMQPAMPIESSFDVLALKGKT